MLQRKGVASKVSMSDCAAADHVLVVRRAVSLQAAADPARARDYDWSVGSGRFDARGALLLAQVEGAIAGCCALRPLDTADYPNASEMKRLYVRKAFRGFGLGRELAEAMLDRARQAGYACVLLDTLDDMESARALYTDLGFEEIPPYYHNPLAGAHYLKVDIS